MYGVFRKSISRFERIWAQQTSVKTFRLIIFLLITSCCLFEVGFSDMRMQSLASSKKAPKSNSIFKIINGVRVIENHYIAKTLIIAGKDWNGTIIRNNVFSGQRGIGLVVSDVQNIVIENNEFYGMQDKALKLKSDQKRGTSNVVIKGNYFHDISEIALFVGEPNANTKILNNRFVNVATDASRKYPRNYPKHAIYIKGPNFIVEGNRISGVTDSHGISIRNSGLVRGNFVEGCAEYGIKYYSDSKTKGNGMLFVENNVVVNNGSAGIGASFSERGISIEKMIIRFNTIVNNGKTGIGLYENLRSSDIDFHIYGNIIIQNNKIYYNLGVEPSFMKNNLTSPSDVGFMSFVKNNFRLKKDSIAIDFVKNIPAVPPYDFAGNKFNKDIYNAGAFQ